MRLADDAEKIVRKARAVRGRVSADPDGGTSEEQSDDQDARYRREAP
jgi:hypothetical protein